MMNFDKALEYAATMQLEPPFEPFDNLTVYISGPMSGQPNDNREAFNTEAKKWEDSGFRVCNPAANIDVSEENIKHAMAADLLVLAQCTDIMMLPGWTHSGGARIELALAVYLGLTIWFVDYLPFEEWGQGRTLRLACHEKRVTLKGTPSTC